MPSISSFRQCLDRLDVYTKRIMKLNREMKEVMQYPIPQAEKAERQDTIRKEIEMEEQRRESLLNELVTFPPRHSRHFPILEGGFHRNGGTYDKSVFIMTKFPGGTTALDDQLNRVITAVKTAVSSCGFIPRIATEKPSFHPLLWDNVELYLCGCQKGIAIVESKYYQELNPNVTMEWGWMRGMGKNVLYLVEETFDLARADLSGLIQETFNWDKPEPEIEKAISGWLGVNK